MEPIFEYRKFLLKQEIFGQHLKELMKKHELSFSDLTRIFYGPNCSRTSLHRVVNGTATHEVYETVADIIEEILPEWLKKSGYSDKEIEIYLDKLFNLQERDMIINRKEMSSAAVKFFGLNAAPFDVDRIPSEMEIFSNKELNEVTESVKDAILYKKWVAVHGPIGSGKTALKIRVARELKASKIKCHLIYPEFFDMNAVTVPAIASAVLEEFGIKPPNNKLTRLTRIRQLLTSLERDDERVALVFDECHRLNDKVLLALKNFWEMTNGGYTRLLGIVLFGQPQFVLTTLRDIKFREIAERVYPVEMPSISKCATDYLTHRIEAVGGNIHELFDEKAIKRICSIAKTPLSLGNLATAALMEAFSEYEEKRVTAQMLDKLNLPDQPRIKALRAA